MLKKVLKWIWQFPQNIIGFLWSRPYHTSMFFKMPDGKSIRVYFTDNVAKCGVCLGQYIILDYERYFAKSYTLEAVRHEYGHSIQSELLGPLYLINIGLVSAARNIYDRLFRELPLA